MITPHTVVPGPVGGWLAVVRGSGALLVRPGAATPEQLYDALASPDAVRRVVEHLTSGGFAATPDFGLVVGSAAGPRHVVVRGPVEIELAEGTVSGTEVSTWAERVVSASATYRILVPSAGEDPGGALPLADGAVWATSIAGGAERPAELPQEARVPEQTVMPEDTVHPSAPPTAVLPVLRAAEDRAADDPAPGYDHLFEATIVRPVEAAAVRPAGESAAAEDVPQPGLESTLGGDHDGMTVLSGDVNGLASRPRPTDDEVARPGERTRYVVLLPDGTRETLDGELLVGRSPSGRVTGDRMPRLVTLPGDPDLSRTHVRIALEGDTVVVTDMHSRNGTTLRIAGQPPRLLRAGEPAAVIPGTVVDLGGGTVLTVQESASGVGG